MIMPPGNLEHLRRLPGGAEWLDALPDLVATSVARWDLELGEPFDDVYESVVFAAERQDGTSVALKVRYPNRDNEHEGTALAAWAGNGAVRLLDEDVDSHAMLLELCEPGTTLSDELPDDALDAFVDLLPRLWIPAAAPYRTLAEEAEVLSRDLESEWLRLRRPFERRLVDAALDAFATLPSGQGPAVLLHQDLHGDNVLLSERGWLAIDPKPLAGERESGIAAIVRSSELGHSPHEVKDRFNRLTRELGLDRARARGWTVAHTVAWAFDEDDVIETHIESARWVLEER